MCLGICSSVHRRDHALRHFGPLPALPGVRGQALTALLRPHPAHGAGRHVRSHLAVHGTHYHAVPPDWRPPHRLLRLPGHGRDDFEYRAN